ncbi:MAG: Spo0E like sporulation regulatory protein [Clostridiales bacterium]|jgi:hypothetical protein|nr:Spo0E like sporulation regulatory protein [Clostridiales bacterium]
MKSSKLNEILKKIEKMRYELEKIENELGRDDPKTIEMSQKLDKLLNEYYNLLKNRKK